MSTQTFSQFIGITAPLKLQSRPADGSRIPIEQVAKSFFSRRRPTLLHVRKNGANLGSVRLETEFCAKHAPAGAGMLHGLTYEIAPGSLISPQLVPPAAELFFDDAFVLRGVRFQLVHDYVRETFEAVLKSPARFHHTRECLTEKVAPTSDGQENWRNWFALATKASPTALRTALRPFRPRFSAIWDESSRAYLVSAKFPAASRQPRLLIRESGKLMRIDQIPGAPGLTLEAG